MAERKNFTTGAPWENIVGYSRAVRIGNTIEISGTTAVENGNVVAAGDLYNQTIFILKLISKVLDDANASISDVIRTRMYVTDISRWEEAARAHAEFFSEIKPATTMVEVKALINPELLIEIEVTAITGK